MTVDSEHLSCSGAEGSKTLRVTLTNANSLLDASIGVISHGSGAEGVIANNTCGALNAGGNSCSFDIEYTTTPISNDLNYTVAVASTGNYFTDITLDTGVGDNSCP